MSKTILKLALVGLLVTVMGAGTALAQPHGKGKSHKAEKHQAKHEEDENVFGFNDDEAGIIAGVLKGLYGDDEDVEIVRPSRDFCPPGLAKKNNGCMPPGLAKKYTVGEKLPEDVIASELPKVLRDVLGLPPKGKRYAQVDNDVLLIEEGTRLVLDAIGLGK